MVLDTVNEDEKVAAAASIRERSERKSMLLRAGFRSEQIVANFAKVRFTPADRTYM